MNAFAFGESMEIIKIFSDTRRMQYVINETAKVKLF